MFGAYKMIDEGTQYRFVFLKYHKNNTGSNMPQDTKIIPKNDMNHLEFIYINAEG
jgi:hypothetical protein